MKTIEPRWILVQKQREQSIQKSLSRMTEERGRSPDSIKLHELQRVDDADRKLYQTFLGSFNDISQRATMTEVGSRVITPASVM